MNTLIDQHRMPTASFINELRLNSGVNDRPFTVAVNQCLNSDLEKFKRDVLDVLAPSGEMEPVKMWNAWEVYWEGMNITRLMSMLQRSLVVRTEKELVCKWLSILDTSDVTTLYTEYGAALLSRVWTMIEMELKYDFAMKKYDIMGRTRIKKPQTYGSGGF